MPKGSSKHFVDMKRYKTLVILYVVLLTVTDGLPMGPPGNPGPPSPISKANCLIDLAFVMDLSTTVGTDGYIKQKKFMRDVVEHLDVGPDSTRVAVVTFSANASIQFGFSPLKSKNDILREISNINDKLLGATRTYVALEKVYRNVYAPGNGERSGVVDVVVVLTDGGTNPASVDNFSREEGKMQTQIEAEKIKSRPAFIFAIGIGNQIDIAELNGISSDPDSTFTVLVDNFKKLDSDEIKQLLYNRVCKVPRPFTPNLPVTTPLWQGDDCNSHIQKALLSRFMECKETVADIFFVLDQSTSINSKSTKHFGKELEFVTNVIDDLDIGEQKTKIGVIKYSTNAHMEISLDEYQTKEELIDRVHKIKWEGGETYIDKALRMVRLQGLNQCHGSRASDGVPQIVVIITDGQASDRSLLNVELKHFHAQNYIVFAIGVGPEINRIELERIAGNKDNVYTLHDVHGLLNIRRMLLTKLCTQSTIVYSSRMKP